MKIYDRNRNVLTLGQRVMIAATGAVDFLRCRKQLPFVPQFSASVQTDFAQLAVFFALHILP